MRIIISVLVVLVVCGPVLGGNVAMTLTEVGEYTAELSYVADTNVSGFGLVITVDSGAVITSVTPEHVGECTASNKGFGIFPENFSRYLDASSPNWGDANYTPVAPNDAPGAAGTGIGYGSVIIEMGALYEAGNAPAKSGVLCTFIVSADCNVSVTADATRGNVVLEDTTEATFTGGVACWPEHEHFWPECWDYTTQCHGDSDGSGSVNIADWPVFRDGFGCCHPSACYINNACSDYNHDGCINILDWPGFRDNFGTSPAGDCPPVTIPNVYAP